jgi:Fe2+ or Zn2+ uptake regulation protein
MSNINPIHPAIMRILIQSSSPMSTIEIHQAVGLGSHLGIDGVNHCLEMLQADGLVTRCFAYDGPAWIVAGQD